MKTLVFFDIHADKKAASFIEAISSGFDEILCCGDICGYGRDFKYCIDMMKGRGIVAVLGNHDKMVLDVDDKLTDIVDVVAKPIKWTRAKIKDKELKYLKSLPMQYESEKSGIFIRHTVGIDEYIRTPLECKKLFNYTSKNIIVIGHTHIQLKHEIDGRIVVNAGSIHGGRANTKPGYVIVEDGVVTLKQRGEWK